MDQLTLERGRYFGYPECCIKWFSEERIEKHPSEMKNLTLAQQTVHGFRGFIPCPTCAAKVTHATIHELISNRACPEPYPHQDIF